MDSTFHIILTIYCYFVKAITLSWKESWVVDLLDNVLQLLMYFHIGIVFGPLNEEFLMRAFDGSINGPLNGNTQNGWAICIIFLFFSFRFNYLLVYYVDAGSAEMLLDERNE